MNVCECNYNNTSSLRGWLLSQGPETKPNRTYKKHRGQVPYSRILPENKHQKLLINFWHLFSKYSVSDCNQVILADAPGASCQKKQKKQPPNLYDAARFRRRDVGHPKLDEHRGGLGTSLA